MARAEHILCELHLIDGDKKLGLYNWKKQNLEMLNGKIDVSAVLHHTGKDNLFVLFENGKITLVELCCGILKERAKILADDKIYRTFVCGDEIYAVTPRDAYVITDAII
ncbi:MAG: hypothetical protein IKU84_07250 [Clostridia bacterium]|nr:hypothetical protein [Clostridia bacterium]